MSAYEEWYQRVLTSHNESADIRTAAEKVLSISEEIDGSLLIGDEKAALRFPIAVFVHERGVFPRMRERTAE